MAQMKDDEEAVPETPEPSNMGATTVLPERVAPSFAASEPSVTVPLPEFSAPSAVEPPPPPVTVPLPVIEPEPIAEEPAPEPSLIIAPTAPLPEIRPEPVAVQPPRPPAPVTLQPPRPPAPVPSPIAMQPPRPPVPVVAPVAVQPPRPPIPVVVPVAPPAPIPEPEPEPEPEPVAIETPEPEPEPAPEPVAVQSAPAPEIKRVPVVAPAAEQVADVPGSVAFNLNTCTAEELVKNIPGCFPGMAESIIRHRTKIGSFKRLEDLLDVPGITKAAYTNLTGEAPPENRMLLSLNELLGFPVEQQISLKDVTERIACWPDVTGCILSQSSGLSLVGTVPQGLSKEAIVAFAPRMFDALNKSFAEITGRETDDLVIPAPGTSFHIFRNKELYLIILSRTPLMPERHMKVARFVLAALGIRRD
jgi:competence ComEA-like helix-hairpin-helix protein